MLFIHKPVLIPDGESKDSWLGGGKINSQIQNESLISTRDAFSHAIDKKMLLTMPCYDSLPLGAVIITQAFAIRYLETL